MCRHFAPADISGMNGLSGQQRNRLAGAMAHLAPPDREWLTLKLWLCESARAASSRTAPTIGRMCGRYTLFKLADLLKLIPWLQAPAEILEREARYNVAPSQLMPIATARDGDAQLRLAEWGFVPSWAKAMPKARPINARAETAATSGMFRHALQAQRCLVPADGFYEWKGAKPPKQPYYIRRRDGLPFTFAGLWSRWRAPGAEPIDTYTILTTQANELMAPIHGRMPVIVPPDRYRDWLEGKDPASVLRPYPAGELEAVAVSPRVNRPAFDGPECIEAGEPEDSARGSQRPVGAAQAPASTPDLFGN